MDAPESKDELDRLTHEARGLKQQFPAFAKWLRDNLNQRRKENDIIGHENKRSEAQCLSEIVELMDS